MQFLLGTLPENIRQNYLSKLKVSIKFWREKGGCLAESTIEKLRRAGVPITVGEKAITGRTKGLYEWNIWMISSYPNLKNCRRIKDSVFVF